jgi:hypothetical protein
VPGTASAFDKRHDSRQGALWRDGQADLGGITRSDPGQIPARAITAL